MKSPAHSLLSFALAALVLAAATAAAPPRRPYLHAPSVTTYARHDPAGRTVLPTGRYLKPMGRHIPLARWPHGGIRWRRDDLAASDPQIAHLPIDAIRRVVDGATRNLDEIGHGTIVAGTLRVP